MYFICQEVLKQQKIEVQVVLFQSAKEVLQSEKEMDLLILDIEMPKMNGIALKDTLQKKQSRGLIIYVTSHEEAMQEAFGIHVYGFVKKREMEEHLPVLLVSALKALGNYCLIDGEINSRDIVYIETEHIYSVLKLKNGKEVLMRHSSREMEEKLQGMDFIRISRSVLVNLGQIQGLWQRNVRLPDRVLPVSVRMWAKVKAEYDAYCRRNARYC